MVLVLVLLDMHARSKLEQPLPVGKALVRQHGSPEFPQVQRPALHWPLVVPELLELHDVPSATHVPPTQHPLLHALPLQQDAPRVPHVRQLPLLDEVDEQTVPAAQRSEPPEPEQQAWPASPHGVHVLPRQVRPL